MLLQEWKPTREVLNCFIFSYQYMITCIYCDMNNLLSSNIECLPKMNIKALNSHRPPTPPPTNLFTLNPPPSIVYYWHSYHHEFLYSLPFNLRYHRLSRPGCPACLCARQPGCPRRVPTGCLRMLWPIYQDLYWAGYLGCFRLLRTKRLQPCGRSATLQLVARM